METWNIRIQGYGTFEFEGTEPEAQERMEAKARHERGMGLKWRRDNQRESDKITQQIAEQFDAGNGVKQSLFTKRKAALEAEAAYPPPFTAQGQGGDMLTRKSPPDALLTTERRS